jgi:hypothetical protein
MEEYFDLTARHWGWASVSASNPPMNQNARCHHLTLVTSDQFRAALDVAIFSPIKDRIEKIRN